jgi:hypothetical protein
VELHGLPDVPMSCAQVERRLLKIHTQTACEDLRDIYSTASDNPCLKVTNWLVGGALQPLEAIRGDV